jgi:RNA polymerase sigma factor (sigma-70 family)
LFPSTQRSAVQGVRDGDPASWERLVSAYWKPAYKHLRLKWNQPPDRAEDGVQSFFAKAHERDFFAAFDPAKARFRTFFKLCLDRHQSNERQRVLRVDFAEAEAELHLSQKVDPDEVFDREWKRQLFAQAVAGLKAGLDPVVFRIFEAYDLSEPPRPRYEDLAQEHGLPVTTVTNHLAKARRELRARVQAALAELEDRL